MNFQKIPQFSKAHYTINVDWDSLPNQLDRYKERYNLDLDPDFQRAHVWVEEQQISFVEYMIKGGLSGRDIYFNHPGWMKYMQGDMVLVDGKQRLNSVSLFLDNKIPAFNTFRKDFQGFISNIDFMFHINDLKTRKEVLQWYLDFNTGGLVHTDEEINKVKVLLERE